MKILFAGSPFWILFTPSLLVPVTSISLPAEAACVMTDVSLQVAIHGSQTTANQSNQVFMGTGNQPCWGNTTTNTSVQLYVGSGNTSQQRTSSHFVNGNGASPLAPYGIESPTIGTQISVPVDIYSPAHDPNFLESLGLPIQP